jgi:hypothetical protein
MKQNFLINFVDKMNNITDYEVVEFIKQIVLIYLDAPKDSYERRTRKTEILKVRQYAEYFVKRHTALSNKKIALLFNQKNHSSVINVVNRIEGYSTWDKTTKKELNEIETIIKLKGLSKNNRFDINSHYYIDMNNCKSIKHSTDKAIVFVGYTDDEIFEIMKSKPEIRNHQNTAKFILERIEKK